jgi:hypothetical protein
MIKQEQLAPYYNTVYIIWNFFNPDFIYDILNCFCCEFLKIFASAQIVCNKMFCKCEVDLIEKWSKIRVLFN